MSRFGGLGISQLMPGAQLRQQGLQHGLDSLNQAFQFGASLYHDSAERHKDRKAQEDAQKKARKEQRKNMLTSLGIGAGAAIATAGIGAALAPAAGGAAAAGTGAAAGAAEGATAGTAGAIGGSTAGTAASSIAPAIPALSSGGLPLHSGFAALPSAGVASATGAPVASLGGGLVAPVSSFGAGGSLAGAGAAGSALTSPALTTFGGNQLGVTGLNTAGTAGALTPAQIGGLSAGAGVGAGLGTGSVAANRPASIQQAPISPSQPRSAMNFSSGTPSVGELARQGGYAINGPGDRLKLFGLLAGRNLANVFAPGSGDSLNPILGSPQYNFQSALGAGTGLANLGLNTARLAEQSRQFDTAEEGRNTRHENYLKARSASGAGTTDPFSKFGYTRDTTFEQAGIAPPKGFSGSDTLGKAGASNYLTPGGGDDGPPLGKKLIDGQLFTDAETRMIREAENRLGAAITGGSSTADQVEILDTLRENNVITPDVHLFLRQKYFGSPNLPLKY